MSIIIKSTLKLLFRNLGFWFFLIATPLLSVFILKTEQTNLSSYEITGADGASHITELDKPEDKVAYYGGKGRFVLKVYDGSGTELSEYMLNKLTESGAFLVCRVKTPGMTMDDMDANIASDGENDRMGAVIWLREGFDDEALQGTVKDGLKVYIMSDDARKDVLFTELKMILGQIRSAAASGGDVITVLDRMNDNIPAKSVEMLASKDSVNLTNEQIDQRTLTGYALAIMTLGFVFAGIFIAHTVINEQKDMVLTRIRLSNLSDTGYFASKFLSGAIVSALLTLVMGAWLFLIPAEKLGMGRPAFLLMIFCLGLIFCALSLLMGILLGNVMSANIAAFTIWSLSSMLAGLYFPLDATNDTVKTISYLMPQKWFLDITERLMTGDNKGYIILVCVTLAYMIVTLSLGSVGIRFKNNE